MTEVFRFYKDSEGWFIDLKDYPGPKADLQMVSGADTMLEEMWWESEENVPEVVLIISDEDFSRAEKLRLIGYTLLSDDNFPEPYPTGADYDYIGKVIWLCPVTTYIFGEYPNVIYYKQIF